jgi:hypothetical protein
MCGVEYLHRELKIDGYASENKAPLLKKFVFEFEWGISFECGVCSNMIRENGVEFHAHEL